MARINMEEIVESLDDNFARVLKTVVDEIAPGNTSDERQIMRIFRMKMERGFDRWEHVSEPTYECVSQNGCSCANFSGPSVDTGPQGAPKT